MSTSDGTPSSHPLSGSAAIFAQAQARIARDPGARLFTVLQWLPERRTLRRVASDHPIEYPIGAEKSLEVSGGWLDEVIGHRRTFLGAHNEDVAAVFSDIDLIRSLGCGSVINAPIVAGDRVIGVLAILDADGAYDDRAVGTVERHVRDLSGSLAIAFARFDLDASGLSACRAEEPA